HQGRGKPSNRKKPAEVRASVLEAYRSVYAGFGPTLATEKLGERLHAPGHDQFPVPGQGLLEKICQDLRQQRTERGKKRRLPAIRKKNPELTVEFHRDICSLWGHSHIALSFV
ncbi:MAG: hypothetical protein ACYCYP_11505, partial [Leptospirales bacterium]